MVICTFKQKVEKGQESLERNGKTFKNDEIGRLPKTLSQ